MHIGINASFLRKPYTGIGQVTTHVLDELAKRSREDKSMKNHKFFVYLEEDDDIELPKNFHKKSFLPKFYKRDDLFRKLLWEKQCVLKQARKDKCNILFSLYQCATINKYTDIKHVMLVHDVIPHIFPEYLDNFRKKTYWQQVEKGMYASNKIITVSEHTKIDLEKKLNIKSAKIVVDKIAVDPIFKNDCCDECVDKVLDKYKLKKGYIYSGGGLELRKNTKGVLRAYKQLRDKWKDTPDLVISGKLMPELSPMVTDVEKIAGELGLGSCVHILGFVQQGELPALYKGARLFVFPSRYEGFGMPVLEAMNMGTPVLTARNSSLEEVGGDAVEYVETDEVDELVEKMEKILKDDERLKKMSVDEKERAKEFSWKKFVDTVCEIICEQ
jgi:glycosyltransferase involved in cell wall biosynthesis